MRITRTTFEPGDDQVETVITDSTGKPLTQDELAEFFRASPKFRRWKPDKPKRTPSGRIGEVHYSPQELAEVWGVSAQTIRNFFEKEPDVLRYGNPETSRSRRKYINMKIPQSVAERVHKRLSAVRPR